MKREREKQIVSFCASKAIINLKKPVNPIIKLKMSRVEYVIEENTIICVKPKEFSVK